MALATACTACSSFQAASQANGDGGAQSMSDASLSEAGAEDAYVSAVLADKPIVYYRLEEKTGALSAASSAMPSITAKIDGPPRMRVAGRVGFAFDFTSSNGPDLDLSAATGFDFAGSAPYTLEAWVNATSSDGSFRHVFTKDSTTAPRQEWGLWLQNGVITFERYVDGTGLKAADPYPLTFKEWHHVVAVYDGTQLLLYVDGQLKDHAADARSAKQKDLGVVIGARALMDDSTAFPGALDELAIYGQALSQERVSAHYGAAPQ
jgi:hypothetical protein